MKRSLHGDKDHPDIAVTLHELGVVSVEAGDLKGAKQHLEESLRMKRSLHGDKDHPGIAATLHELGIVSRQAGDLKGAKQQLEESLRMERSLHGDKEARRKWYEAWAINRKTRFVKLPDNLPK